MIEVDVQQALQRTAACRHAPAACRAGRREPAFGLAVLVTDVADQHFQHILHGQEADHLVVAFFPPARNARRPGGTLQQAGQRHVLDTRSSGRSSSSGRNARRAIVGRQRQQQVLDVQQADVLALDAVIDRVAAVLVAADDFQNLAQRASCSSCSRSSRELAQSTTSVHSSLPPRPAPGSAGCSESRARLECRISLSSRGCSDGRGVRRLATAGDAQDGIGAGVEQVDRRVHQPVEQVQRRGRQSDSSSGLRIARDLGASSPMTMCR